jgi:hypothetical protein
MARATKRTAARRLDGIFGEAPPRFQPLDRQLKPIDIKQVRITSSDMESITPILYTYKGKVYVVDYNDEEKLSAEALQKLTVISLDNKEDKIFKDKQGIFYTDQGYPMIDKSNLTIKYKDNWPEEYWVNVKGKPARLLRNYGTDYNYIVDAGFTAADLKLNRPLLLPVVIYPEKSKHAFYIQMTDDSLRGQTSVKATFVIDGQPHELTLKKVGENTFRSKALTLATLANGVDKNSFIAEPGSKLSIIYKGPEEPLNGLRLKNGGYVSFQESVEILLGTVPIEHVVEMEVYVVKDQNYEANLKSAHEQVEDLQMRMASTGTQYKIKIFDLEVGTTAAALHPEPYAAFIGEYSKPNTLKMIVGASNHGIFYTSKDALKEPKAQGTFYIDPRSPKITPQSTSAIVTKMLISPDDFSSWPEITEQNFRLDEEKVNAIRHSKSPILQRAEVTQPAVRLTAPTP